MSAGGTTAAGTAAAGAGAGAAEAGTAAGARMEPDATATDRGWGEPSKRVMPRATPAPIAPIRPAATITLSMDFGVAAGVIGSGGKSWAYATSTDLSDGSPSGLDAQAQAEVTSSARGAKVVRSMSCKVLMTCFFRCGARPGLGRCHR